MPHCPQQCLPSHRTPDASATPVPQLSREPTSMAKRLLVAYGLWALGGPLGLHHLYLGRDSHALLWMLTLGGFGAGWLSDLWHLHHWVAMANSTSSQHRRAVPALSPILLAGQVVVGTYFGLVAALALPWVPQLLAQPLAVGLGVLLTASVGEQSTKAHRVLTAAFLTSLLFQAQLLAVLPSSMAAGMVAQRHRRYQHPAGPPLRLRARLFRLGMAYMAFAVPVGYSLLHSTAGALGWVGTIPMRSLQSLAWMLGLKAGPGGCTERQLWAYQVWGALRRGEEGGLVVEGLHGV